MMYPSTEFDDAISDMCHGTISDESLSELSRVLKQNQDAMDEYLWRLEVHGHLGATFESLGAKKRIRHHQKKHFAPFIFPAAVTAAAAVIALAFGLFHLSQMKKPPETSAAERLSQNTVAPSNPGNQPIVGHLTNMNNVRWMKPETKISRGQGIKKNQSLALSDGAAILTLKSGATVKFSGPAILHPLSENSVFLSMGRAKVVASTPRSKGFALVTPQSRFVDVGTEFTVTADSNGGNKVVVEKGEVNAYLDGSDNALKVLEGGSLQIDSGPKKIITRVEAGTRTPAYQFPTLPPPSHKDYADLSQGNAQFFVGPEALSKYGSPRGVAILQDGVSHSDPQKGENSIIFNGHHFLVVDLGRIVPIKQINTYTWSEFTNRKVRQSIWQKIKLFGYTGDKHFNENSVPDWQEALDEDWVQITEIRTRDHFVGQMDIAFAQQVSAIISATGDIGKYRYLIFQTHGRSFYGEIDIFVSE